MVRKIIVIASMLVMILGVVVPAVPSTSASSTPVVTGNYWEYTFDSNETDQRINGSIKWKVEKTENQTVSGTSTSVQVLSVVGSGMISDPADPSSMTINFTIAGQEVRRTSNFSLVSDSMTMAWNYNTTYGTDWLDMSLEGLIKTSYNPSLDDYIGDDDHLVGTTVKSKTNMTTNSTTWTNTTSSNPLYNDDSTDWSNESVEATLVLRVLEKNVSVTTPAGTFSCFKVNATVNGTSTSGDSSWENSSGDMYYSDVVGNYVKIGSGASSFGSMFGNLTLKAYSYTKDSTAPVANAGKDQRIKPGETANFSASSSTDNIGIVNYTWKFATGTTTAVQHTLYGPTANFTFEDEEKYTVTLTVRDAAGNVDDDEMKVTVEKNAGISALFKGTNLMIILGVIAAVIIVLVAVMIMRKKGKAPAPSTVVEQETPPPPA